LYLKKVELQGFKSFADKTVIEFDKNITSIVGPNGSGKSNIADAIRWVLGEQSMKNLRGSRFEDIIFSGTAARKSMGFAEVSLVLDNTQKMIDLDYTEITISRRIFRNGSSEYYINMVPCRLKDIHEMFYDTGVGRTGYSVVGQGKIDEILSSRSEDRREVFEEASGIMKFKLRKLESEKKLESTEQNLVRIKDIINELELQLEPLSLQAEKAKKYLNLRDELKSSEVSLYVHNVNRLRERNSKLDEFLEEKEELIQARKHELNQLSEKEKMRSNASKEIDLKIKTANDEYHELKSEIDRIRAEVALIEEKNKNKEENLERSIEEIEKLKNNRDTILSDTQKKKERMSYLEKQLLQFRNKLEGYEKQYSELTKDLGDDESDINQIKDQVLDRLDLLSDKKNQLNNLRSYIASIEKRKTDIKTEIVTLLSEKDTLLSKKNESNKALSRFDNEINAVAATNIEKEKQRNILKKQIADSESENTRLSNEINFLSSRLKVLRDMEENYEGYSRSVKEILVKSEKDKIFAQGIHGPLAKLLDVTKEYSVPIDIAIGPALQNIVTEDEDAAKRAVDFLKKHEIGRATFLPISSIKPSYLPENTKTRLNNMKGYIRIASDAVGCKQIYRDIVDSFLSRTVIADNLDSAIMISREFKNDFRIVTLDGEIINRGGAITGGSIKGTASNLLLRTTEAEELNIRLQNLDMEYKAKKHEYEIRKKDLTLLDEEIKINENRINSLRIEFVKEQGNIKLVLEAMERTEARTEMLGSENVRLVKDTTKNNEDAARYTKEITDTEEDVRILKSDIDKKTNRQKERQSSRDDLHQEITDHKISVNSVIESISNIQEGLDVLVKEDRQIDEEIEKINDEIAKSKKMLELNLGKKEKYFIELSTAEQRMIGKDTLISRFQQEKENLEEAIGQTGKQKEDTEVEIEKIRDEKNKIEIRKVKCESEIDTIKNRLWDEYELTINNCEKTAMPVDNIQKTQSDIDDLRNSIKDLGDVNVNAIDDYVKTKERYEFLTNQHHDMVKAGDDLSKVIKEMEAIMKAQFLDQFRKINEIFNQVFKDLFLGGTASISLVDESNVLESAIDINVQPPGKKLQNMMLLSGGEKAFTAIALLFAIIKLKDTPFCVLDEIDAALDDPNVSRFADYVRELTKRTQFILVTHRKGTMEASDVLYGVTAQEKGVSKVISLVMNS
jgi:chromosome segregation protein